MDETVTYTYIQGQLVNGRYGRVKRWNECLRCGYPWFSSGDKHPKKCPQCNSPYWDKPRTREKKENEESYVYAFQLLDTPYVKIGVSSSPKIRLRSLQTGTPIDLILIGMWLVSSQKVEVEVHAHFSHLRKKREWFVMSDDDITALRLFMSVQSNVHSATPPIGTNQSGISRKTMRM